MAHTHQTTRAFDSVVLPGVTVILKKMTEGRRIELRKLIGPFNKKIRDLLRGQAEIEQQPDETRDMAKYLDLQDEYDGVMVCEINPAWIIWGVKQIEGLEVDGTSLGVKEWENWPSAFFDEVLNAVKGEAELNGVGRKNSSSPTMPGEQGSSSPSLSIVESAKKEAGGETETADSTSQIM